MACCRQNNSGGCGNNNWGHGNHGYDRNRRCRRELEEAVDTLEAIEDLADDFLDDFFDDKRRGRRNCGCNNNYEHSYNREDSYNGEGRGHRGGCGCNNYWGR